MTATTKSIAKNRTITTSTMDTTAKISSGALVSLSSAGAVVGLWSCASLIGAMVSVGGPFTLAKAWFGAVAGL